MAAAQDLTVKNLTVEGDLSVKGTLTVKGKCIAGEIRSAGGIVRWGNNDTVNTPDQTIFLQPAAGSYDKQSCLIQKPVAVDNAAIFAQVPGDELTHGYIAAQLIQYAPKKADNTFRQRMVYAVNTQSDGGSYVYVGTTLTVAKGDKGSMRPMPMQVAYGSTILVNLNNDKLTWKER